jgi:hypothetical protein
MATTTVQRLSDLWNELRNAALGRGTKLPAGMSSELADEVADAWEEWRAWLADQGAMAEAQREITLLGEGREWADRYDELADQVSRATGKKLASAPSSPVEQVISQAAGLASPLALALFVGAGVVLATKALSGVRRSR